MLQRGMASQDEDIRGKTRQKQDKTRPGEARQGQAKVQDIIITHTRTHTCKYLRMFIRYGFVYVRSFSKEVREKLFGVSAYVHATLIRVNLWVRGFDHTQIAIRRRGPQS